MKVVTKIIIILLLLILVTDIASSFYFYNLSVARTKKDFLANDSALRSTVTAESISTTSADVAVSAKLYSVKQEDTVELDWFNNQLYKEVSITSDDGLRLVGYYLSAEQPTDKTVIMAHGYSSQGTYMGSYAKIYYDMGYNVLLPDSRGHGKSEGNYIGFGWTDRKDFLKWIDFIISQTGQDAQIVLHGVSMGGAAVLMTSGEELPSAVRAVVSDCAYTSVQAELEYQLDRLFKLPAFPVLDTTSLLTRLRAGYSFKEASALEQVKKSSTPTLFIHGDSDMFVPSSMVYELYDASTCPKDIYIVQGAGHGAAFETDVSGYKNKIREFTEKYVN
ncbi:alpha/beta hydrolase family protein [Ruminiclostridium hungatei]|uniref:Alpha/beta hydrolase family protein n=1 Tax=Ruminiclostridium hungatei TaxID=48256 RepID=A0A1V4SQ70_RUMHU|nr:alpha/beta hydrolase [Ruminiclostridium hungatei]OPX46029.1 alpha/beta hydrolase family protein [Ruminiclostridium hungatei]